MVSLIFLKYPLSCHLYHSRRRWDPMKLCCCRTCRGYPWHSSESGDPNPCTSGIPTLSTVQRGVTFLQAVRQSEVGNPIATTSTLGDGLCFKAYRIRYQEDACPTMSPAVASPAEDDNHHFSLCTTTPLSFRSDFSRRRYAVPRMLQFTCGAAATEKSDLHETLTDHHEILRAPSYAKKCNILERVLRTMHAITQYTE